MNPLVTSSSSSSTLSPDLRFDAAEIAYAAGTVLMPYLVAALLLLAFA